MSNKIVCVGCPKGCIIEVEKKGDGFCVVGSKCKRGMEFAQKELSDPERIVTTTVVVRGASQPLISVKTDRPVKKDEIADILDMLRCISVSAPIQCGQVLMANVGKNKANIIATCSAEKV